MSRPSRGTGDGSEQRRCHPTPTHAVDGTRPHWPANGKLVPGDVHGNRLRRRIRRHDRVVHDQQRTDVCSRAVLHRSQTVGLRSPYSLEARRDGGDRDGQQYVMVVRASDSAGNHITASAARDCSARQWPLIGRDEECKSFVSQARRRLMDDAHDPGQASHVPPGIPSFRNRLFAPPAWCVRTVIVSAFDRSDPVDRPSTSATTPVRGRCDARRVSRSAVIRRGPNLDDDVATMHLA